MCGGAHTVQTDNLSHDGRRVFLTKPSENGIDNPLQGSEHE